MARRGDPIALKLLRAPEFPRAFSYLFDWYAEFTQWAPRERVPEWTDWLAWATLMRYTPTPFDMRVLKQIHDVHTAPKPAPKGKA